MYPIIFRIGEINIYTHGLLIAVGALIGGGVIYYLAKRSHLETRFLFDFLIVSLFGGIIGARLTYVLFYPSQFDSWIQIFYLWYGGLVSFGGLVAGFIIAALILKRHRQPILRYFDIGIIGLLIGWTFGRIGCFLSGDITGIVSSSKLALNGQMPVALFEAAWTAIIAATGLYFYLHPRWQKIIPAGLYFYSGLGLYGLGRLSLDFLRQENVIYILKGGQIAALLLFAIAFLVIWSKYLRGGKYAQKSFG